MLDTKLKRVAFETAFRHLTRSNYRSTPRMVRNLIEAAQILSAKKISKSLQINIVTQTIDNLFNSPLSLHKEAFIHSDQGSHYNSPIFQKKLKEKGIGLV